MTNFAIGFCLLPQVILYTQVPENQKFSVDANQGFLKVVLILVEAKCNLHQKIQ